MLLVVGILMRLIGQVVIRALVIWFKVFGVARVFVVNLLFLAVLVATGYEWFSLLLGDFWLWVWLILLVLVGLWRWLIIIAMPLSIRTLPTHKPKALADLINTEYEYLFTRLDKLQLEIDKFLLLPVWDAADYVETSFNELRKFRKQWAIVVSGLMQLNGLRKQFSRFFELDYKTNPKQFAKAFTVADLSHAFLLLNSLKIVDKVNQHAFVQEILDDSDGELGLLAENYTSLLAHVLHINEVARVYLGFAFWRYWRKRSPSSFLDKDLSRVQSQIHRINEILASTGVYNLFLLLGRIFKKESYQLWFFVQKNISEMASNYRLPVRDYSLIGLEELEILKSKLQPGDILVARSNWYLSNVGLPGFWLHSFMFIDEIEQFVEFFNDIACLNYLKDTYGNDNLLDILRGEFPLLVKKWQSKNQFGQYPTIIESVAEGVVINSLEKTGAVDYLAAMRPRLSKVQKLQALISALSSFGKPYDFNFDFKLDSSTGCSELVYKSYSSVVDFPVKPRLVGGWLTLPPNEFVKSFAEEQKLKRKIWRKGRKPFWEFVEFIDGKPNLGTAVFRKASALAKSSRRPKWDFVLEQWWG